MEQNNCNNTCFHAAIILITCKHKFGKCVVLKVEKPERIYDEIFSIFSTQFLKYFIILTT